MFRIFIRTFRQRCREVQPIWFASVMGTGMSANLLHNFPYPARWLKICSWIFWIYSMGLMLGLLILTVIRYSNRGELKRMILHINESSGLGCIPMGFATIINMIYNLYPSSWQVTYVFWWIDVFLSLMSAWVVLMVMFFFHKRSMDKVLGSILLPVVALVVASSTGAILIPGQPESLRYSSTIMSLLLLSNGECLAFVLTTIFCVRLFIYNLPEKAAVMTIFLPLGPLGQGGFSVLTNAINASLVPQFAPYGDILLTMGVICALALFGYGTFWFIGGYSAIFVRRKTMTFAAPWWSLTFPVGTYALSSAKIGATLNSEAFKVIGSLVTVLEVLTSILCSILAVWFGLIQPTIRASRFQDDKTSESETTYSRGESFAIPSNATTEQV